MSKKKKKNKLLIQNYFRNYTADVSNASGVDADELKLTISISSEFAVRRYDFYNDEYFDEVLSHDPADVDLSRAANGASFRDEHYGDQIGVLANPVIRDKKLYVDVIFSKNNERAVTIYKDMVDNIRRNVSIRPEYTGQGRQIGTNDAGEKIIAFPWRLIHAAVVADPADPDVGVNRNNDNNNFKQLTYQNSSEDHQMNKELRAKLIALGMDRNATDAEAQAFLVLPETQTKLMRSFEPKEKPKTEPVRSTSSAEGEKNRILEIQEIARSFEVENKKVNHAIENGINVDTFRANVMKQLIDRNKLEPVSSKKADPNIGMGSNDLRNYSVLKVLRAKMEGTPLTGLELECAQAVAKQRGKAAEGFYIPYDVLADSSINMRAVNNMRSMSVGSGHTLVNTDMQYGSFIDVLRNAMVIGQLGVQFLTGLVGDVAIPKKTGTAQYFFTGEGEEVNESNLTFSQIGLSPKHCGTFIEFSKKLLMQSGMDTESLIRADLAECMALAIQDMIIFGDSTKKQPKGILNNSEVTKLSFDNDLLKYDGVIDLETKVADANAATGRLAYLTNTLVRGDLKKTFINDNSDKSLWTKDNKLNGYDAVVTNSVPRNLGTNTDLSAIIYGDWSQVLVGMWSGLDLNVNPYSKDIQGIIRIVAGMDFDLAIRRKDAFAYAHVATA
ncbi:phage major capsid protein [Lentisphaerota bacterium WC36G]|nr:phage major capsid protein [Lentisphaerae bacterium WC36]